MTTFNNTTLSNTIPVQSNGTTSSNPFICVFEPRDPTSADIQYPTQKPWLNTITNRRWILKGYTSNSGQLFAVWAESGSDQGVESFITNVSGPVVPNASHQVLVNASVSTFTDGSVANTLKTEVQGTNHALFIGRGVGIPATTLGVATNGQLAIGSTGADPVLATITAGAGITVTNGAGSITITATNAGDIQTIQGDIGSVTGSTVSIKALSSAASTLGNSVTFVGSGTAMTLQPTDALICTIIGQDAGAIGRTGVGNTGYGFQSLQRLTSGEGNTSYGVANLNFCTTGSNNEGFGGSCLTNTVTGNRNLGIGSNSGNALSGAESDNILIKASGNIGESNGIYIGRQGSGSGQQDKCFIAGIVGVTTSNSNIVTINTSTGQLGATTFTGLFPWTTEGGNFSILSNNGYIATGAITGTMPASPSNGDIVAFVQQYLTTGLTIRAVSGQTINFNGSNSGPNGFFTCATQFGSAAFVYTSVNNFWTNLYFTGAWGN